MRLFTISLIVVLSSLLPAQETTAWNATQDGYFDDTLALAEFCALNGLHSEARRLANLCAKALPDESKRIAESSKDKPAQHSATKWSSYLDRVALLQRKRADAAWRETKDARTTLGIDADHTDARKAQGQRWHTAFGWLSNDEFDHLDACLVGDEKPDRKVTWDAPYVFDGGTFTLVTDLSFATAQKLSRQLDAFAVLFREVFGSHIPARKRPNVIWCCKDDKTFIGLGERFGANTVKELSGLYVGHVGQVLINAERAKWLGKKNKVKNNLLRTIIHECVHRLVDVGLCDDRPSFVFRKYQNKANAWLVESAAVLFEGTEVKREGAEYVAVLDSFDYQRQWTIDLTWKRRKKTPSLKSVFENNAATFGRPKPIAVVEKYALAGSVAWYCVKERPDDFREAYLGLLVDYYRGVAAGLGWNSRFGVEMDAFDTAWSNWVLAKKKAED